jgi:hypothetical protein
MTSEAVWLLHVSATACMTGIIWFVQLVHYPLFDAAGREAFAAFERRHQARTTVVVAPAMLLELVTAVALVAWPPAGISARLLHVGLALLAVVWASTWLLQVPCHTQLAGGFDAAVHRRLVASNWIRTVGWTARTVLLVGATVFAAL